MEAIKPRSCAILHFVPLQSLRHSVTHSADTHCESADGETVNRLIVGRGSMFQQAQQLAFLSAAASSASSPSTFVMLSTVLAGCGTRSQRCLHVDLCTLSTIAC